MLRELAEQDMYRPVGLIVKVVRTEGRLRETGEIGYYETISTGTGTLVRKKPGELTSHHILTSRHVLELGPHSFQNNPLISKFASCEMRIISQSFYIEGSWYPIEEHSRKHPVICVARLGRHVPNILPARIGRIKNEELLRRLTGATKDGEEFASTFYLAQSLTTPLPHSLTLCGFGLPEKLEQAINPLFRAWRQETDIIYPPQKPSSATVPASSALAASSPLDADVVNPSDQDEQADESSSTASAEATIKPSPFGFRKVDGAALLIAEEHLTQGPFPDLRSRGLKNHRKRACMLFALEPSKMPQNSHDHWVISTLSEVAFALPSQFREDFFETQWGRRARGTWSLYGVPTPGDSGAPLFYQNAGSDKGPFVVGIHELSGVHDPGHGYHAPHHKEFTGSVTFNGEDVEETGIWPKGF